MTGILFNRIGPSNGLPIAFCGDIGSLPSFLSCAVGGHACHCFGNRPLFPFNCNLDCAAFRCNGPALVRIGDEGHNDGTTSCGLVFSLRGANGHRNARITRICVGHVSSISNPVGDLGSFGHISLGTNRHRVIDVSLPHGDFRN